MLHDNLAHILETIAETAIRVGRDPQGIKLVAVSKTVDVALIRQAVDCGQTSFGENYLQEAAGKIPLLTSSTTWHLIGHLQSNKARLAVELFDVIQTVDRWKLAKALDTHSKKLNKKLPVLIQVNTGREKQKSGVPSEMAEGLLRQIAQETDLDVRGLMTIPPFFSDPEKSRPYFKELFHLAKRLAALNLFADNTNVELSMGMSDDYPIAIEEGATIVRVGTALFGARNSIGVI
jgi:pyridoxal phosphate enzyme (YggS family)